MGDSIKAITIWQYQISYLILALMERKKSIGDQIKEARIAKGFKNQAQLAVKLNMSVNTISGLESGRKKSTSITILKIIGNELNIKFEI